MNNNNTAEEFSDNPIVLMKEGINKIKRWKRTLNTPTNSGDYIFTYGILEFNSKNGLFKYKNKKSITMFEDKDPYKIMYLLFSNHGTEIEYKLIAEKIGLKFSTQKEQKTAKGKIRQTFKNTRRILKINSRTNPEGNPFIMTGNGVKLAFLNE
ncbi:MAG: hypothetical protein KIH89_001620 [Candidatus Shapirobacteria bacterium]|nr:hypothetical protein [Candidatus Shapirobacteria bacterium]